MTIQNLIKSDPRNKHLICQGEWTLAHLMQLKRELALISLPSTDKIIVDGAAIADMDTAGALILNQWIHQISDRGIKIQVENFSDPHQKLLTLLQKQSQQKFSITRYKMPNGLARVGMVTISQLQEARIFLAFVGFLAIKVLAILINPKHIRWRELAGSIYKAGYQALPIIALMSFMIGVVLAYQTGIQLQKYGANIFIVELLGFAVLREFGPLITAIMVAGRTGSAFTAQLGLMKINQEIDMLDTMSVTPAELLLIPRIVALVIVLPLLTIWADIFGILGGMLVTSHVLHISWYEFLNRFQSEVPLRGLIIGLIKAPVFGLIVATIGCFQGMQVESTADSLGRLTTRSVVMGIFFIVVADVFFSILFNQFNL